VLRRARESRGWSLREVAELAGLSPGHLSHIETGSRDPSWATLQRIAGVWNLEPLLCLVAPEETRQARAIDLSQLDPADRLARQDGAVFNAALLLAMRVTDAAITGAAAAVLQGLPAAVELLEALVVDTDEAVEQLVRLLMGSQSLFEEIPPDAYRALDRQTWVVGQADAVIHLVPELPTSLPMTLDDVPVRVVALAHLLETDPIVADAAGVPPPRGA